MGEAGLTKLRFSGPIKGSTFYPAKGFEILTSKLTLVAASLPTTMKTDQRQASPLEPFNFMLCSSILFFSLPKPISRQRKHHISSMEHFNFEPYSSISSHFLFCQATQELDEAFVKLPEACSTNSPKNYLFPLLRASVSHRKPKRSLSHAKLTNAQLPYHKLLMPSPRIYL
ncbi:hypothetical protein L3X38_001557 [Prunus dulcis]|uniref:Uncharacterized protein n=1 Tax=Prunus dulcis TaxID=3755 RepID=A0AAD4ZJY5_PRUDU|nr:hypothetical protein L3X38_001557 [Prunus dulcis]